MVWVIACVVGVVGVVAGLAGCAAGFFQGRRWAQVDAQPQVEATKPAVVPPVVSQLLGSLRSASAVVGPHDEVLSASPQARAFGLVRGTRIVPADLLDNVRTARREDRIVGQELVIQRAAGYAPLHLLTRAAPIDGDLIVVLAEDRSHALRVDETRRDFVTNVSHELKTPIGAISLLAEAVEDAADDPDAVRHFAARMGEESRRLSELVGQIIALSRLQAADPMLTAKPVDVQDMLTSAVERSRELATNREVAVTQVCDEGCAVMGDVGQLTDAVANLVHNAIVYSEAGARVVVSARRAREDDERWIDIAVSDNGIGISPADQKRIFERFYRVDYARSRANGGTGLGLSIVKHVAQVHGGSVSVWSHLGQGSTFTIRLPELLAPTEPANDTAMKDEA